MCEQELRSRQHLCRPRSLHLSVPAKRVVETAAGSSEVEPRSGFTGQDISELDCFLSLDPLPPIQAWDSQPLACEGLQSRCPLV
ncbi:MAG: hypothetical protein J07HQX50_01961 [Haloquadratum sp. J07HQX50]|nr:MAG: hypothetical protein J07HQX50_01961 [Haloquadratum sp. J07HQX50]